MGEAAFPKGEINLGVISMVFIYQALVFFIRAFVLLTQEHLAGLPCFFSLTYYYDD